MKLYLLLFIFILSVATVTTSVFADSSDYWAECAGSCSDNICGSSGYWDHCCTVGQNLGSTYFCCYVSGYTWFNGYCCPDDTRSCSNTCDYTKTPAEYCTGITQTCNNLGNWGSCSGGSCVCTPGQCGVPAGGCTIPIDFDVTFCQNGLNSQTQNWAVKVGTTVTYISGFRPASCITRYNIPANTRYDYQAFSGYTCTNGCGGLITSNNQKTATYTLSPCPSYGTQSSCNGASGCTWCTGDGSCKASTSVVCQPGQCNGASQYCTSSCTWSTCPGTNAQCYCSGGSCQSCGSNICSVPSYTCVPPSGTCSETDGGNNPTAAGTCTDASGSIGDYCSGGTTLSEAYCSSSDVCIRAPDKNCQDYENYYCNANGNYYRDEWRCSIDLSVGASYCNNGAADTLIETCSDSCSVECNSNSDCASNNCNLATCTCVGVDNPPSCLISSISESSSYAYASGSTVWYSTASSGSFTVNVAASDDKGVSSVSFPATVSSGGSDTTSPYSRTYSWDTSDTFSSSATVTAFDTISQTGTCQFTVTRDSTAPTTTASISGSYSITLSRSDNSGGSGVASTQYCFGSGCVPNIGYTAAVGTTCSGCCYVSYRSTDRVDNQESTKTTTFGPTCGCACSSGACCDGCNYRPSSYTCNSNLQTDYSCYWGTACGNDVGVRYFRQNCTGTSSTCSGTTYWTGYSVSDYCGSTEKCIEDVSTCSYASTCDCVCSSGVCCDGCNYRPSGYDCGDCRICDGSSGCNYKCTGSVTSCECIPSDDSCRNCASFYGTDCDYGTCNINQKPSWSCSSGTCTYSCYNDDAGCLNACALTSAAISRNCGGDTICEEGNTISMTAAYTGDCRAADFLQIDARGGGCELSWTGGDMQGIGRTVSSGGMDGGTFTATWTIPTVTQACSGQTVNAFASGLYDGGAPGTPGTQRIGYTEALSGWFTFEVIDADITISSTPTLGSGYVTVDGSAITTARTFTWTPGSTHTLSAASIVSCDTGCQNVFNSWSDGGARTHTITTPTNPTTYTANYQRQYYLDMQDTPSGRGSVTPADGWRNSGSPVTIQATADYGFGFMSWSGSGTGSYSGTSNPRSITISGAITEIANFAVDECDALDDPRCDDGEICTADTCIDPLAPNSVCQNTDEPTTKQCGTEYCGDDYCDDAASTLYYYNPDDCTLFCDGSGSCESTCKPCTPLTQQCWLNGNWDGDAILCNCDCGDYDIEETATNGNTCGDGKDNDCDTLIDTREPDCPETSMNFSGTLTYSTGLPVKNSLVEVVISNTIMGFVKKGHSLTDSEGNFFVRLQSLTHKMMNSDFDLAIYVAGEVEAIYEGHYNRETGQCR